LHDHQSTRRAPALDYHLATIRRAGVMTEVPHQTDDRAERTSPYRPPTIVHLGNLADLTQKTAGNSDGSTFLGLDIASF
jgi:hypothetical protein